MNNLFPTAGLFTLATATVNEVPTSLTEAFTQYGFPALICGVLLWYSFWQEKQRNKRDASHKEFTENVIREINTENRELKDKLFEISDKLLQNK